MLLLLFTGQVCSKVVVGDSGSGDSGGWWVVGREDWNCGESGMNERR